jgi:predicted aspartyl protease
LALLQEEIEDGNPKSAPRQLGQKPFSRQNFSPTFRQQAPPAIDTKSAATNAKISALKAYRKARGECFTCGEKWGPGHKCSTTVKLQVVEELLAMLSMTGSDGENSPEAEEFVDAPADTHEAEFMAISKQAFNGSENGHSMKLMGQIQGHDVLILVDSGSTNNFISTSLAAQLQGVQKLSKPVKVKVAGGGMLQGDLEVPDCEWTCQGNVFATSFKALPLHCYDVILGMQWLEQFGLMQTHWAQKWFQFEWKGKQCRLQGLQPNT